MIGAGTVINPIIKIVTTVVILGAVYLFIVKPTLDTTEDISDRAFDTSSDIQESVRADLEDAFNDVPQVDTTNIQIPDSAKQAQKLGDCVTRRRHRHRQDQPMHEQVLAVKRVAALGAIAVAYLILMWPSTGSAATPKCFGETATIVRNGGGEIIGTAKRDVIVAKGGEYTIRGRGGADLICSGADEDRVSGGAGADRINSGGDSDGVSGERGDDFLNGSGGEDAIAGGAFVELDSDTGNDILRGGGGDDGLFAHDGNDRVRGGKGEDRLYGQEGNDRLFGEDDPDFLDGGPGANDLCDGGAPTPDDPPLSYDLATDACERFRDAVMTSPI